MRFDPTLAAVRFGSGLSPIIGPPDNTDAILAEIDDVFAFAIPGYSDADPSISDYQQASMTRTKARGTDQAEATEQAFREVRQAANRVYDQALRSSLARHVGAQIGFKPRLSAFFADHFTVKSRGGPQRHLVTPFVEDAVTPHLNGYFSAMLRAVITHSMMLLYLQQFQSVGPTSTVGKRRNRGINENLARELLELHTLGVDGVYAQADVRELAELLTGLTYNGQRGFFYDERFAEPGAETVLGITYDAADGLDNILHAIDDLAVHPQTARHIAGKIAAAFVADTPDVGLVDAMTAAFVATDGFLPSVYAAMLDHPASWHADLLKIKSPQRFITSAMRALGVTGDQVDQASGRNTRALFVTPLRVMGQPWERPNGPDGWPEDSTDWISPQGMAGRISWAMTAPRILVQNRLPDPRDFVQTALGSLAGQDVIFAASAAEVRDEGVGVVLASPAFQRS